LDAAPGAEIGVDRVVYDPATHTVYAHPATQLAPDTTYQLRLDGTGENGLPQLRTTFTTESAPSGLLAMRRQLDNGTAFDAAGIAPADRGLHIDADVPAAGTTLAYTEDLGSGHTRTVPVFTTGADESLPLRPEGVSYYGQSFGGIYGVMLGGTDPRVPVLAPNVSGGPISEIARLSPSFRLLVTQDLANRQPSLLNSTSSALAFFNESMPQRGDPPVTSPAPGAVAIQQAIADETWINRSGSPETFAPLLRATPPAGSTPKQVLFQNAYGDRTVPNPTNYTVLAAGGLFDRESFYRNDLSPNAGSNPHSFLLNAAFVDGSVPGQQQISTFLASGGQTVLDPNQFAPDGAAGVWEVPIANPAEMLDLHFPSPLHS
jgi:prepilin-type processing-associated H-X9-DG protein